MEPTILERRADREGRILLPKKWRERHGNDVIVLQFDDELRLLPKESKPLAELPELNAALTARLTDWRAVKAELLRKR